MPITPSPLLKIFRGGHPARTEDLAHAPVVMIELVIE
jgi:hypothetical protein